MHPEPSFPHNTLPRRLRRRFYPDSTRILGVVIVVPPVICSLSWLLHGPLWLILTSGVIWGLSMLAMTFLMTVNLVTTRSIRHLAPFVSMRFSVLGMIVVSTATLLALMMRHIDWAFYLMFGLMNLLGLLTDRPLSFGTVLNMVFGAALCLAFAQHTAWIIVPLLLLQGLCASIFKLNLRERILRLPTRAEHVARLREAFDGGGGEVLLKTMCEAEQWEDGLSELERLSVAQPLREKAVVWKARIYIGLERYEEVLELEEAGRENGSIETYLAVAHARLGHPEKALRIAEEALQRKRSGAEMAMGHVYFADKQYDLALRWYEATSQNETKRPVALSAIGKTLICLGDYQEASVVYEQAIRLTPFVRPTDLLQLAKCLHHTQQERAAAEMEILAHEKE